MHDTQFPQHTAWYKTGGGVVFLGVLAVLLLALAMFGSYVGYYVYQIDAGNGDDIARQLFEQTKFSTKAGADSGSISDAPDPAPYIRSHNAQFGNTASPIKVIAFIDFECPFCREAFPTFETIREQYESGVHIVFKHFPISSIHPLATRAGVAASCAQEQDAFWSFYKKIFTSTALSRDALIGYATAIGLHEDAFVACLDTNRTQAYISQDIKDGFDLGVRGTPTYFIGNTKLEGVVPMDVWNTELIRALQSE